MRAYQMFEHPMSLYRSPRNYFGRRKLSFRGEARVLIGWCAVRRIVMVVLYQPLKASDIIHGLHPDGFAGRGQLGLHRSSLSIQRKVVSTHSGAGFSWCACHSISRWSTYLHNISTYLRSRMYSDPSISIRRITFPNAPFSPSVS
jgi:hypothetical protein